MRKWLSSILVVSLMLQQIMPAAAMVRDDDKEDKGKGEIPVVTAPSVPQVNSTNNNATSSLVSPSLEQPFAKALAAVKGLKSSHSDLKGLGDTKPTCFISYAWGVPEQEKTVHTLASHLKAGGINVFLDIWHNTGGTSTLQFAQKILDETTDFVVLCGSKKLMEKLDENNVNDSVVRVEVLDLLAQRMTWARGKRNILPILLEGQHKEVLPRFLWNTVSIGFQKKEDYPLNCFALLKQLYKIEHGDSFIEQIIKDFNAYKAPLTNSPVVNNPTIKIEPIQPSPLSRKKQLKQIANGEGLEAQKAQYQLGLMFRDGDDVIKDTSKAIQWLEKPAKAGHSDSLNALSQLYFDKQDYKLALKYVKKLIERQDAEGQSRLGDMYENGWGVEKDDMEALKWHQKAANQGYEAAQKKLAMHAEQDEIQQKMPSLEPLPPTTSPDSRTYSVNNNDKEGEQVKEALKATSSLTFQKKLVTISITRALQKVEQEEISLVEFMEILNSDPPSMLNLLSDRIHTKGVTALAKALEINSTLTQLNLDSDYIGTKGVTALAKVLETNSTLKQMSLRYNNMGDEGLMAIAQALETNSTLTYVDLGISLRFRSNNDCTCRSSVLLGICEEAKILEHPIGAEGAKALAKALTTNSTIKQMNLYGIPIGNEGAKALAKALTTNSTLNQLDLWFNSIGAAGGTAIAQALEINSTIKQLNFYGNPTGDEGIKALAKALEMNSTLKELYLSESRISDEGARAMAKALGKVSVLIQLDISKNSMGNEGVKILAESLKTNSILTQLDLSKNSIDDGGVKALTKALEMNSTLKELGLRNNSIDEKGAKTLSQALQQNTTLTQIDLSHNSISVNLNKLIKGLLKLNKLIKEKVTLESLNLHGLNLGNEGIRKLIVLFFPSPSLTSLDLSSNQIGADGITALAPALKGLTSLTTLDLMGNPIGDMGKKALEEFKESSPSLKIYY